MEKISTRQIALYGLFIALVFLLGFTPLGYIYLPLASITTVHIPVIVGSYILGRKGGAVLGFFFGLTSLIKCFITPDAISAIMLGTSTGFGLYNLVLIAAVIFLPRILVGFFSASVYDIAVKKGVNEGLAMGISAFVGSMTNTVFFLGGLYILAFEQTAQAMGVAGEALLSLLLGIVALNGVIEAIAAVIISVAAGKAITAIARRSSK